MNDEQYMFTHVIKVLIVDDNEEFRTTLNQMIREHEGFEVIAQAKNGREAIYLTQILSPDIVFMDISMPELNGLEAARTIKESSPQTQIIFVTIHEERTYRAVAEFLPADGFISKASLKLDLKNVLRNIKSNIPHPAVFQ
ncbi:MAG: response regulator transcription factor [Ignavibacteriales bacterium]|nr:response regulator transcription factor [Ignavibacteriales bacterium]